MTGPERGFLLLTGKLGNPHRRSLTVAQFRTLAMRVAGAQRQTGERQLQVRDLVALGYEASAARLIAELLDEGELLQHYLSRGSRMDCCPITRISSGYPMDVRCKLGLDSPGCLWAKGDISLLQMPRISLVGSRDLRPENHAFAAEAGKQAARQGFVLVSGNARGADRAAQLSCLENGGRVICVVADQLEKYPLQRNVLYLAEDGYDMEFTSPRALSRNRVIHALGSAVLVAQSSVDRGGTWDGARRNLKNRWSPLYCCRDGSDAALRLSQLGAQLIGTEDLTDLAQLSRSDFQIKMEDLL